MNKTKTSAILVISLLFASQPGCPRDSKPREMQVNAPRSLLASALDGGNGLVLAQGRLEPVSGVIPIVAKPGDRILSFAPGIKIGATVAANASLGELAGQKLLQRELDVAEAQLQEAEVRLEKEQASAQATLEVARSAVAGNKLRLDQAEQSLKIAQATGGRLDLLKSKAEMAEKEAQRLENAHKESSGGRRLVSATQVEQQLLASQAALAEYENAKREAQNAVEFARLALTASEKEVRAAELQIESAKAAVPLESSRQQVELLRAQIEAAKLTSPIDGQIVSIDAAVGDTTSSMPIMRIANNNQMQCRAEVPVEDIKFISIGNAAAINQGGLPRTIKGVVSAIGTIVGSPRSNSLNPMDPVDFRVIQVLIDIADKEDIQLAAKLIHSKVEVAIAKDSNVSSQPTTNDAP